MLLDPTKIRNIAIIAHVDHGKTTLVDKLLQQSGAFGERATIVERAMDSNDLEKERGITILAKNTAVDYEGYRINIVDTPGHADFGGEVERVLSMVDSVLLIVDAVDGPMPQTRFVTQKAFAQGLHPIVVINKIDRPGARPNWVVDQVFDLFAKLGASDEQLDFPIVYASALQGYAKLDLKDETTDMSVLFQTIIDKVSPPNADINGPFQMQISSLDYSNYVGVIGIGRITRGKARTNMPVTVIDVAGKTRNGRILQVLGHMGLKRIEVPEASAGDIICITGLENIFISDTVCDPTCVEAMTPLSVDEPTVTMTFQVNNSPFAGKEGKYVTSRQIRERIAPLTSAGRPLGCRPEVIFHTLEDGTTEEPFEWVTIDVEEANQGGVMERMGMRQGDLLNMVPDGQGRVRLEYMIPTRGLIGFRTEFMSLTSGTGIITHVFDHYGPMKKNVANERPRGVLIANIAGKALGYALFNLQDRGLMMIDHGTEVYEGMIIGIHSRDNDLVVNVIKGKQLTNIRAAGTDENIVLTTPIKHSLEQALEFINDDELVEVTPKSIRLRKRFLTENERKRADRSKAE
ncbi:MAG: GTP-binding protein TypA [Gammaproteobacteria bacterium]|nr:GTP-binding protein TypA [Gammaproteobacteria bacterium]